MTRACRVPCLPRPSQEKDEAREAKREAKAAKEAEKASAPKKPMAAYMHFQAAVRERLVSENPEAKSVGAIAKLCSAEWKALGEEEKAKYEEMATKDRERYESECAEKGIEVAKPKEKKEPKVRRSAPP